MDLGLLCMFYALYYGVMARDFAEICTEKMAANIGYYKSEGIPERHLEQDICAGIIGISCKGFYLFFFSSLCQQTVSIS